ncbi:MAG TPA: NrfD/PsrC family molybdoenzyme membrane anchor subunit [Phycisphaerae bacterium]|nr:NrfD/PsrC family molybdoenzyme membrane anchor subunit [Phycisphaerae bacterium]
MPSPTDMVRQPAQGMPPSGRPLDVHDPAKGPSYYDVSMLKPPVWKWQIATYFFLGGLSAGAFVLARIAERFGGEEFRQITRFGTYTAILAAAPCPLLLIDDLGDRSRFHHMLRVWKPSSPMNLGTWVLTAITPIAGAAALREFFRHRDHLRALPAASKVRRLVRRGERVLRRQAPPGMLNVVSGSIGVIADAAGVPLAFLLATYTGVLISNTATPVWTQNKWLSPLFAVGAMSTGATAIGLAMEMTRASGAPESRAERALRHFSTAAHVAEIAAFSGYLASLKGRIRHPFTRGTMKHHTLYTFAGLAVAETLKHWPASAGGGKLLKIAGHLASLSSAFSVRWSVVYAAHESGKDAEAARMVSRAKSPAQYGWLKGAERPERTAGIADPQAISTLDPALKINPRHR